MFGGFLQEETLLPGICGTISAVVAATMAVKVLTRTGQWPGNVMGARQPAPFPALRPRR